MHTMKAFMDKDFLLQTRTAQALYREYAERMPIVDYHCHVSPADIADNRQYDNITQIWLGGDHYKWRAMRCNGVPEQEITGCQATDPYTTFLRWAETLPKAIGSPLYHWSYMELKTYFGVEEPLNAQSAKKIYDHCNARLAQEDMRVRGIIGQSNVKLICTTDDPADDLAMHKKIAADAACKVKVLPAFRPDKAVNIDRPGFADYIGKLSAASGIAVKSFADLRKALHSRIDYFNSMGCRSSDHGLDTCIYAEATGTELDAILAEGLAAPVKCADKIEKFKTAVLLLLAEKYAEHGWVMQVHYGAVRNVSDKMLAKLGPDTGFDAMGNSGSAEKLARMLGAMESGGFLPRTVLYSLNQYDNEIIATVGGCFLADSGCAGKIQLGSAWWYNDTKAGMEKQLTDSGNLGVLGNFIGMLTDSRSFLSYTRHDYFRRILCNHFGNLVENGEYHNDIPALGRMVQDICYNNTVRFFGFSV